MWKLSWRTDPRARIIADRHYSRKKPGTRGFVQSGSCMVLLSDNEDAVWVTVNPIKEYVLHQWAGAWQCSMFRNEGPTLSSLMIREAVACTRWWYRTPPPLGMITFVDSSKVRHKRDPGRCYLKAGFHYIMVPQAEGPPIRATTKSGLVVLQMLPSEMPPPQQPYLLEAPMSTLLTAFDH